MRRYLFSWFYLACFSGWFPGWMHSFAQSPALLPDELRIPVSVSNQLKTPAVLWKDSILWVGTGLGSGASSDEGFWFWIQVNLPDSLRLDTSMSLFRIQPVDGLSVGEDTVLWLVRVFPGKWAILPWKIQELLPLDTWLLSPSGGYVRAPGFLFSSQDGRDWTILPESHICGGQILRILRLRPFQMPLVDFHYVIGDSCNSDTIWDVLAGGIDTSMGRVGILIRKRLRTSAQWYLETYWFSSGNSPVFLARTSHPLPSGHLPLAGGTALSEGRLDSLAGWWLLLTQDTLTEQFWVVHLPDMKICSLPAGWWISVQPLDSPGNFLVHGTQWKWQTWTATQIHIQTTSCSWRESCSWGTLATQVARKSFPLNAGNARILLGHRATTVDTSAFLWEITLLRTYRDTCVLPCPHPVLSVDTMAVCFSGSALLRNETSESGIFQWTVCDTFSMDWEFSLDVSQCDTTQFPHLVVLTALPCGLSDSLWLVENPFFAELQVVRDSMLCIRGDTTTIQQILYWKYDSFWTLPDTSWCIPVTCPSCVYEVGVVDTTGCLHILRAVPILLGVNEEFRRYSMRRPELGIYPLRVWIDGRILPPSHATGNEISGFLRFWIRKSYRIYK